MLRNSIRIELIPNAAQNVSLQHHPQHQNLTANFKNGQNDNSTAYSLPNSTAAEQILTATNPAHTKLDSNRE